jgi:hypothetical protein
MNITVEIPDRIVGALTGEGRDAPRAVLEAVALEGYRTKRLSEYQVRQLLGFSYFQEVHAFLKEHGVYLHYSMEDWEHDLAEVRRFGALKTDVPEHQAG